MSDISCRVFEFFERNAEVYGYSLAELTDGVGADLAVLQDPSQRVPWEVWVELCERFEVLVGGPDETVRAGQRIIDMGFSGPVRTIGGALLAPELVYEAVVRWLGPYFFRNLIWHLQRPAPGQVIIEVQVPAHQPVSSAWFRMARGAFVTVPQAVDAGDAVVTAQISGQTARFDIRCTSARTFWSRLRVWLRAVFRPGQLLEHLEELQNDLRSALGQAVAGQNELRRILVSIPDPVAVLRDETLLWTNSAWREALGERMPVNLSAHLSDNVIHIDHEGQRAFELAAPVAITWEDEAAKLVLLRDVTQVRQLAEHMRIADRLGALGMIAASVGHEINNPLAVALGSLELSLADAEQADLSIKENLERAIEAINQAAGVTSDLLTVARDTGELERVDMGEVVQTALRLAGNELRHVPNLEVRMDVEEALPALEGSRQRLTQVVLNLVVNAAHALVERPDAQHKLVINAGYAADSVIVDIEDTGPGIPATLLADVKEPFFTTKGRRGSGLGLAVCERIVSEHGGSIELKNLNPRGTRATVRLPVGQAAAGPLQREQAATLPLEPALRVLVVDDQADICNIVTQYLAPHEVVSANSFDDALVRIAQDARFDVVILDVMLAGTSGIALRDALPPALKPRTLFITGGVFLQEENTELSDVDAPVITKPFTKNELLKAVASVTAGRGLQHSA